MHLYPKSCLDASKFWQTWNVQYYWTEWVYLFSHSNSVGHLFFRHLVPLLLLASWKLRPALYQTRSHLRFLQYYYQLLSPLSASHEMCTFTEMQVQSKMQPMSCISARRAQLPRSPRWFKCYLAGFKRNCQLGEKAEKTRSLNLQSLRVKGAVLAPSLICSGNHPLTKEEQWWERTEFWSNMQKQCTHEGLKLCPAPFQRPPSSFWQRSPV